jgi:CubicO group peptidase (beta-lactamase class C family)
VADSDINLETLGELAPRVSGKPLDLYCSRHNFAPLGMKETRFKPPATWRPRFSIGRDQQNPYEIPRLSQNQLKGRREARKEFGIIEGLPRITNLGTLTGPSGPV